MDGGRRAGVASMAAFVMVLVALMVFWVPSVDRFRPDHGDRCALYSYDGCERWVSGRPPFDVRNGSGQSEATIASLVLAGSAAWLAYRLTGLTLSREA